MTFLAPYLLWGTAAAGIPIALHFFFRSRYRRVPWAAMSFLLASIEQTSRRFRFQELLLLLVRVAFLVLLALALARPTFQALGSGGEAVDAVVLLDHSYSMDVRDGRSTRLEQAREAAASLLDQLPPHSTVQVVTCSDRAAVLGPREPSDLEQARAIIQSVEISHQATDLLPGVNEAAAALRRGQAANKELYLFSDMQRLGWEQQGAALAGRLREIDTWAHLTLVRCGFRVPGNAGIVGIVPQLGILHAGERAAFAVLVRNRGSEPVRNLTVTLTVDGKDREREAQPLLEIGPGETRTVTLAARLTKPGLSILTATLTPDDLLADNRFDQVVQVHDRVRVLVVDGAADTRHPEKSASFYLMHALQPVRAEERARYPVQPALITSQRAIPSLLADADLCVLVDVALEQEEAGRGETLPPAFVAALDSFVRAGHGLIVFAGDHVRPGPYNRAFYQEHQLLPAPLTKGAPPGAGPFRLDRDSAGAPAFAMFREDRAFQSLNGIDVSRRLDLETVDGKGHALLRYSDGRPAILTGKVGAGEVMLVTTSANLSWTNWPLSHGMYVPFVDAALAHLLRGQTGQHNETAGHPLRWQPSEGDATRPFVVHYPDGHNERLGPSALWEGRPLLQVEATARAGIYRLAPAGAGAAEGIPFAVTPDPRETESLDTLGDAELDERLGFQPTHLTAGGGPLPVSAARLNREWTLWLLAGVVLLAVAEMGLAWLCGRAG